MRTRGLNLKRILVPTDFSRTSEQALRYAVPLARQVGGQITLLHVIEWLPPATLSAVAPDPSTVSGAARQALDQLARKSVPPELLEKILVRVGRPYEVIADAASRLRMNLVVIATLGSTNLRPVLLGRTAERVVRHAPCPVLTVRRGAGMKTPGRKSSSLAPRINRILVPVDFSRQSKASVRFAATLARTMHARLGLLHVVSPMQVTSGRYKAELRRWQVEITGEARHNLTALAAAVPRGIQVEVLLRQTIPYRGILETARAWRSDLIVLPTRGWTGAKYIVLGRTAEAVVRHAPCPVLTLGQTHSTRGQAT